MEHTSGKWYRRDPFRDDDSGDVGGDVQVGPAHSVSWQQRLFTDRPRYETLTVYYFAAQSDPMGQYVQCMIELIVHRDPEDPGSTEINSDYRYRDVYALPSTDTAILARTLADMAEEQADLILIRDYFAADLIGAYGGQEGEGLECEVCGRNDLATTVPPRCNRHIPGGVAG